MSSYEKFWEFNYTLIWSWAICEKLPLLIRGHSLLYWTAWDGYEMLDPTLPFVAPNSKWSPSRQVYEIQVMQYLHSYQSVKSTALGRWWLLSCFMLTSSPIQFLRSDFPLAEKLYKTLKIAIIGGSCKKGLHTLLALDLLPSRLLDNDHHYLRL